MRRGAKFFRPHLVFDARNGSGPDASRQQHSAFREVILPHMDAAYNYARNLSRDPIAAEDIVQDAFLRAFRGFDGWRGEGAKTWLLAIVRNVFLDWVKANRQTNHSSETIQDEAGACKMNEADIDRNTPESLLLQAHDVRLLRLTVERLPEPFREALVLRELEELSYKEIATITDVPIGTVMSRLARSRQMLGVLLLPDDGSDRKAQA